MNWLKQLFLLTVYRPADAASALLKLKLSVSNGWIALAAASALNAVAFHITLFAFPPEVSLPLVSNLSPLSFAAMIFVIMGGSASVLFWAGRTMKGAASFSEILTLIAWLQFMRLAVQVGGFVLMLFVPGLASLAMMLAGLYGVWILLNFLNVAQGFASLGKSAMTLVLSFIGLTVVLSILMSFVGLGSFG